MKLSVFPEGFLVCFFSFLLFMAEGSRGMEKRVRGRLNWLCYGTLRAIQTLEPSSRWVLFWRHIRTIGVILELL